MASTPLAWITRQDLVQLVELSKQIFSAPDLSDLAKVVCAAVRRLVDADGATFVLAEDDLVYYAEEDAIAELWKGRRFPADACISGWAVKHRRAAAIADIYEDPRIPQDAYRPTFVKSLAMTPLPPEAEPIGAMGAYWSTLHEPTDRELYLLDALATYAGAAAICMTRTADDGLLGEDGEALQRMIAIVAHDLRSPLGAALNATDLLRIRGDLTTADEAVVDLIRRSTDRATGLVRQLADFADRRQKNLVVRPLPLRLDEFCREVASEISGVYAQAEILVDGPEINGHFDRRQLAEALANLIGNAVQHGDTTHPITVRLRNGDDDAEISVHNMGNPIPRTKLDSIFEPFAQGAASKDPTSVGLGLYIARQIVLAHGGELTVASSAKKGTTFRIRLPLGAAQLQ